MVRNGSAISAPRPTASPAQRCHRLPSAERDTGAKRQRPPAGAARAAGQRFQRRLVCGQPARALRRRAGATSTATAARMWLSTMLKNGCLACTCRRPMAAWKPNGCSRRAQGRRWTAASWRCWASTATAGWTSWLAATCCWAGHGAKLGRLRWALRRRPCARRAARMCCATWTPRLPRARQARDHGTGSTKPPLRTSLSICGSSVRAAAKSCAPLAEQWQLEGV